MKTQSIIVTDLGSEIIAAISRNSKLECAADEMRKAIKYYNDAGKHIPEVKEKSLSDALNAANDYSRLAYDNPNAKVSDMKLCFSFFKRHSSN